MHQLSHKLTPPESDNTWLGLSERSLPVALAYEWIVLPECGAVVLFSGTSRNHSPGRPDVRLLEYEAYETQVLPRFESIAQKMRCMWADLGRIVLLHRVGEVIVGESAVIVAASAPHRETAFSAARFGIDAVKSTVPIWKREHWQGGEDWGLESQPLVDLESPTIATNTAPEPNAPTNTGVMI